VLSVPATWGRELVATLNLYSRSGPFDESAASVATVLATQVAIAVSRSPEFAAARAVVEEAQRTAEDRADMDLASGLLMVSQGCTAEQAEALLQEAASHDAETILEIAHRIIKQHNSAR
jgi:AmiR/NasT family two-component response regulator